MAGYSRQEDANIVTGAIIQYTHLDNEFDALEAAFHATTGHDHTGGAGLGPKIILTTGVTGTLPVGNGGTGAATLTDGGILLGSGTSAVTALGVLSDGSVVVGDGATDPVAITCFTSSTGLLIHERGGIETDISAIADGGALVGTGAGTMAIRTGVFTAGAAGFLTHEVGGLEVSVAAVTTDNFLVGTSAGVIGVRSAAQARAHLSLEAGTDVQAWDANLDQIAALAPTDNNFIVGNGSAWALETPANVRTSLGLVIGTNVQAEDAGLTSIAGLTTAANRMIYTTASDTYAVATLTSAGRNLIDDASTSAQRTTLGLVIGTDVQAQDAQLADVAGLAVTDSSFIVGDGSNFVLENASTARTSLGLGTSATVNSGTSSGNVPLVGTTSATDVLAGLIETATQAEQETGTAVDKVVTPGRQQFHQSAAKLWASVDRSGGTPSLNSPSYNVSGVTDNGVGQTIVTIATDFSTAVYAVGSEPIDTGSPQSMTHTLAIGSFKVKQTDNAGTAADTIDFTCWAFGDVNL